MAREIGGSILSADGGIIRMAETLGIEVLTAEAFLLRYGEESDRGE